VLHTLRLPHALVPGVVGSYALCFGVAQTLQTRLRAPSSAWQVPQEWVRYRPRRQQIAVWGLTLGPGLITRNPYASMWLLPGFLALTGSVQAGLVAGALIGASHGAARALGVILNVAVLRARVEHAMLSLVVSQTIDGLWLLVIAGAVIGRWLV
jgi:hypothetical protein